jgi:hypothetical protein
MKRFYRTVYTFEVLSTECLISEDMDLTRLDYEVSEGHCSGDFIHTSSEIVEHATMARLLAKQRSMEEFFFGADNDGEECPSCKNGTIEVLEDEICCRGECGSTWSRDYETTLTRPVEFLLVHEDQTWDTVIDRVPVEIRWDQMQTYADKLLGRSSVLCAVKIIPWNEDPYA